ncbi:MAG: hypothetical protein ACR2H3_01500, partial [Acidimicrobiales bacterium]
MTVASEPVRESTAQLSRGLDVGDIPVVASIGALFGVKLWVAMRGIVVGSPDSRWYRELDWSGRGRLPSASLIYAILPTDRLAVVLVAVVSALCIALLIWEVAATVRGVDGNYPLSGVSAVVIAGIALSGRFLLWDRVIYSESLTVSFTALTLALLLKLIRDQRPWVLLAGFLSALFLASLRETGPATLVLWWLAVVPVVTTMVRTSVASRWTVIVALAGSVPLALGLAWYGGQNTKGTAM